jgi:hypothetical protein
MGIFALIADNLSRNIECLQSCAIHLATYGQAIVAETHQPVFVACENGGKFAFTASGRT